MPTLRSAGKSYNNVVYLENELRKNVISLLVEVDAESQKAALGYEAYLKDQRREGPKWWEVPGPMVSVALLLSTAALFGVVYPWTKVEWAAVPVNSMLSLAVTRVTFKMVRRRRDIGTNKAEHG